MGKLGEKTSNYLIIPFNFHSYHHLICRGGEGAKMYGYRSQNTAFLVCLVRLHCYQNMATLVICTTVLYSYCITPHHSVRCGPAHAQVCPQLLKYRLEMDSVCSASVCLANDQMQFASPPWHIHICMLIFPHSSVNTT